MAKNNWNDSQHSQKGSPQAEDQTAVRQHHRLATGQPVTGQTNPNGGAASNKKTIANGAGKNY